MKRDKQYFSEIIAWSDHFYGKKGADYRFDFYQIKRPQLNRNTYDFFKPEFVGSLVIDE